MRDKREERLECRASACVIPAFSLVQLLACRLREQCFDVSWIEFNSGSGKHSMHVTP